MCRMGLKKTINNKVSHKINYVEGNRSDRLD